MRPTGLQGTLQIEHNRIVNLIDPSGDDDAGVGLRNEDPDGTIDARRNWWGCNAGPDPDLFPGCRDVTHPGGSTVPFTPWMLLSLTATPLPLFAGDQSTLLASLDHLSDGTTPSGPFFLTGLASFSSSPLGTHEPPVAPLRTEDVSAQSEYTAGAADPDQVRTKVDNQPLHIDISRPPRPDVVPAIEPTPPTFTPDEQVSILIRLVNHGNGTARRLRACLTLSPKLHRSGSRCRQLARLRPGHTRIFRVRIRARRACGGRSGTGSRSGSPGSRRACGAHSDGWSPRAADRVQPSRSPPARSISRAVGSRPPLQRFGARFAREPPAERARKRRETAPASDRIP